MNNEECQNWFTDNAIFWVSDVNGINIPSIVAKRLLNAAYSVDETEDLLNSLNFVYNKNNMMEDGYYEVFDEILQRTFTFNTKDSPKDYNIMQDGDVWLIPADMPDEVSEWLASTTF